MKKQKSTAPVIEKAKEPSLLYEKPINELALSSYNDCLQAFIEYLYPFPLDNYPFTEGLTETEQSVLLLEYKDKIRLWKDDPNLQIENIKQWIQQTQEHIVNAVREETTLPLGNLIGELAEDPKEQNAEESTERKNHKTFNTLAQQGIANRALLYKLVIERSSFLEQLISNVRYQKFRKEELKREEIAFESFVLATMPIPEFQDLNDIRFAVWEMLEAYFPWEETTYKWQKRISFASPKPERDSFMLEQLNTHNRREPLIWNLALTPKEPEVQWVDEKLIQIEKAIEGQDQLASIHILCKPYVDGDSRSRPIKGSPARYQLYQWLLERLMLNPPQELKAFKRFIPRIHNLAELVPSQKAKEKQVEKIGLKTSLEAMREPFIELEKIAETIWHGKELSPEERKKENEKRMHSGLETLKKRNDFLQGQIELEKNKRLKEDYRQLREASNTPLSSPIMEKEENKNKASNNEELINAQGFKIHLDHQRKNLTCSGKLLTETRLFEILKMLIENPEGLTKEQLLILWKDDRSDNKERRLFEGISKLRRFFNEVEPNLGRQLLPDARKNSWIYTLQI